MNTIHNGLARAFLQAKEEMEIVHFHPDLFLGSQCHDYELTVLHGFTNLFVCLNALFNSII
jgi:hypothetical protein